MKGEKLTSLTRRNTATLFGVHLRTIFRWINKGVLKTRSGYITKSDIKESLRLWRCSTPKRDFRKDRGVSFTTIRNWKTKGFIKTVEVMGEERVLNSSIPTGLAKWFGHKKLKNYQTISYLVRVSGSSHATINQYLGTEIDFKVVRGRKLIPLKEAKRITDIIESSCTVSEACGIMQLGNDAIRYRIKTGELKSTRFLGQIRVLFDSMPKDTTTSKNVENFTFERKENRENKIVVTRKKRSKLLATKLLHEQKETERLNARKERLRKKKRRLSDKRRRRRLKREKKIAERLALKAETKAQKLLLKQIDSDKKRQGKLRKKRTPLTYQVKIKKEIPDYEPKLVVKEIMGRNQNVTTIEEASKAMGICDFEINKLMNAGTLRFCEDEGVRFPYYISVKAWVNKARAQ